MSKRVLITGGAGFIGSHVADELIAHGYNVCLLDNLAAQVHGQQRARPGYLDRRAELMVGDVRDAQVVRRALRDVDVVVHLAALVGVGQSMYQLTDYASVNTAGTATLLEALIDHRVERLVVASSMSVYGEGLYHSEDGVPHTHVKRRMGDIARARWEPRDARGVPLAPVATPESKPACVSSVYALTKYDQERMCLITGEAYQIPTVALRLFNVYGPRQALSNPYTGVLAIFAARYLNDRPPLVFEDGRQRRDFVHVGDVARAFRLAIEADSAPGQVLNIGSGRPRTICEIAGELGKLLGKEHLQPEVTGEYRSGDIRHCFADISLAQRTLGYQPARELDQGLRELVTWLASQTAVDRVSQARAELIARGLTI